MDVNFGLRFGAVSHHSISMLEDLIEYNRLRPKPTGVMEALAQDRRVARPPPAAYIAFPCPPVHGPRVCSISTVSLRVCVRVCPT
eukprot:7686485-Alexandrium_andersonii.AAC.1